MKKIKELNQNQKKCLLKKSSQWFKAELRDFLLNLLLISLISLVVFCWYDFWGERNIEVSLEEIMNQIRNQGPYVTLVSVLILFLLFSGIFILILEIFRFFKSLVFLKKKKINLYYNKSQGYTPFKKYRGKKNKKVMFLSHISLIPEKLPKDNVFYCENIVVLDCIIEEGYWGLVCNCRDEKALLWKKINPFLSKFEINLIQERFRMGKEISGIISQTKDKDKILNYILVEWDFPV